MMFLFETECAMAGGTYQGNGVTCDDAGCPQPGACCLPDGTCRQESELGGTACLADGGMYEGDGTNCGDIECPQPCPADFDGSGDVGFGDLVQLLSAWGPCTGCPQDLDGDDTVGFSDLVFVLSAWGACP